jgi:hypothetical protein
VPRPLCRPPGGVASTRGDARGTASSSAPAAAAWWAPRRAAATVQEAAAALRVGWVPARAQSPEQGPARRLAPEVQRRAAVEHQRPKRPRRRARRARARWPKASPSLVCRSRPDERSPRKVRCQRALRTTRNPIVLGAERLPAASTARRRASNVPGRSRRARILARNRRSFTPAEPNWVNSPTGR